MDCPDPYEPLDSHISAEKNGQTCQTCFKSSAEGKSKNNHEIGFINDDHPYCKSRTGILFYFYSDLVVRSCTTVTVEKKCHPDHKEAEKSCYCNEELCNAASVTTYTMGLYVWPILTIFGML